MLGVQQVSLSVLDQSPVRSGGTAQEAVQESLLLAQAADRLGYTRYWVAAVSYTHLTLPTTPYE